MMLFQTKGEGRGITHLGAGVPMYLLLQLIPIDYFQFPRQQGLSLKEYSRFWDNLELELWFMAIVKSPTSQE